MSKDQLEMAGSFLNQEHRNTSNTNIEKMIRFTMFYCALLVVPGMNMHGKYIKWNALMLKLLHSLCEKTGET